MILPFNTAIWLYRHPVDFRRQIDGLMMMVADTLQRDPTSGQLFVFRNRACDKIKMLHWQDNGFWLLYKRNESGRFVFPMTGADTVSLTLEELQWLLSGLDLSMQRKRVPLRYTRFF
jgi:transposase